MEAFYSGGWGPNLTPHGHALGVVGGGAAQAAHALRHGGVSREDEPRVPKAAQVLARVKTDWPSVWGLFRAESIRQNPHLRVTRWAQLPRRAAPSLGGRPR